MAWFQKTKATVDASEKRTLGEGVFRKCEGCGETLPADHFTENLEVCPACGYHYQMSAEGWCEYLLDPGSFEEHDAKLRAQDPLGFVDSKKYAERVSATIRKSGVNDAFLSGSGTLQGKPVELGCFVYRFMGGSMG